MKVCILGGNGYLGWPTSLFLSRQGHDVLIIDNFAKRQWEVEMAVAPLLSIPAMPERLQRWRDVSNLSLAFVECDVCADYDALEDTLRRFQPEAIVHYAEQPSAPFSMADRLRAIETQTNNVIGTLNLVYAIRAACPGAHLIKLGTMGEYGTPNIDIEEGWIDITHKGRSARVVFPKSPGSIYHLSKVHDSANLEFACRTWGNKVTDLNQGVVWGIETDESRLDQGLHTSFHYDAVFGTVLNRFVVQAVVGLPLTVYGQGSQKRGFINIRDTMRCVEITALNPPPAGQFRVFNQITSHHSLNGLACLVSEQAQELGLKAAVAHIDNPRVEAETHYYNPMHSALEKLGLVPHRLDGMAVRSMLQTMMPYKNKVDLDQVAPTITWN